MVSCVYGVDYSVLTGNREPSNHKFAEELGDVVEDFQLNGIPKEEAEDYLK